MSAREKSWGFNLILLGLLIQIPSPSIAKNNLNATEDSIQQEQICFADLSKKIDKIVNRPEWLRSQWGISIDSLTSQQPLYELNADQYFIPASNIKLLSSAVALWKLGTNFRTKTSFYISKLSSNITRLRIVGRGDPTLNIEKLKTIALQLKQKGINVINELIVDDSYLKNTTITDSWEWGDIYFDYGVTPSSFILEENTINLAITPEKIGAPVKLEWSDKLAGRQWQIENRAITKEAGTPSTISLQANLGNNQLIIKGELSIDSEPDIWGIAIPNPTQYFLDTWQQILLDVGIKVTRSKIATSNDPVNFNELEIDTIQSPTLGDLLIKVNQDSNNLFAETILEILAAETQKNKFDIIEETLTKWGIDRTQYRINDAAGLSRQNLITPKILIQILKLMFDSNSSQKIDQSTQNSYINSLAVAGTNGTLKKRFIDTKIQGILRGKTGTLRGVATLSGYLDLPDYEPLIFSIMLNNSIEPITIMRSSIDEIVLQIGRLRHCDQNISNDSR
jgi:serine-type D-Ala-D-Ala carboxypeptidase/endopeptidase (penicillin-binding protein 4)